MSAPNAAQMDRLLEFLETNEDLARGHMRTVEGRQRSQTLWSDITEALNSIEGGCVKNVRQWQKVWSDRKYLTKKSASTAGGFTDYLSLSSVERRILAIIGDELAEHDIPRDPTFVTPHERPTTSRERKPSPHQLFLPPTQLKREPKLRRRRRLCTLKNVISLEENRLAAEKRRNFYLHGIRDEIRGMRSCMEAHVQVMKELLEEMRQRRDTHSQPFSY